LSEEKKKITELANFNIQQWVKSRCGDGKHEKLDREKFWFGDSWGVR
jgi:hypothetical protein